MSEEQQQASLVEEVRTLRQQVHSLQEAEQRRRETEEALHNSEQRYRVLVEHMHDGMFMIQEGKVALANTSLAESIGYTKEELIGMEFSAVVAPEDVEMVVERYHRRQRGEDIPSHYSLRLLHKDQIRRVECDMHVALVSYKGRSATLGTLKDITAEKELERRRSEFIAMLSHDIKNPLGIILGYADMLLEQTKERGDTADITLLERLVSSALTIRSLVANYLDLSKLEAGQFTLNKEPVILNSLVRQVGQQHEATVQRRNLTLEFSLRKDLPILEGDPVALGRVFANLLHNALKFTPEGGTVQVTTDWQGEEVLLMVADTGPGMAPEEIPQLFEKYRRANNVRGREGLGLGLFIVKNLVEAHGGRIEVKSVPGQGSCFTVFLPCPQ